MFKLDLRVCKRHSSDAVVHFLTSVVQFLQDEVEEYCEASSEDQQVFYNTADMQLIYSSASEGEGSVIGGVHLELLVDHYPPPNSANSSFWKVCEFLRNEGYGNELAITLRAVTK